MAFKCNMLECEERLGEELGYCDCGHVFCVYHSKSWFSSHHSCPLCSTKVRVRWFNFASDRPRALVGCTPEAMLRALEEGMRFWTQQKELERAQKLEKESAGVEFLKEKLKEAERVIHALQGALAPPACNPCLLPLPPSTPCVFSPPSTSRFPN